MRGLTGRVAYAAAAIFLASTSAARALDSRAPTITSVLPVVIKAAAVAELLGANPLQLSAVTCSDAGEIAPVPFQLDEYDAGGHLISNLAGESSRDESAGRIDPGDELVFLMRDAGGACPARVLGELRGRIVPVRIEADYLRNPGRIYFVIAERSARLSRRYVRYSSAEDRIHADAYDIGFKQDNPLIGDYFVSRELRGRQNTNIFDRMKFRFTARALGNLLSFTGDEDDLVCSLRAARVGPVRVLREVRVAFTPVPGFTVDADVLFAYYPRVWEIHATVHMPQAAALFASSMDAVVSIDYRDKRGIRLSTRAFPEGVLVDGRMLASERSLSMGDEHWYQETGEGINLVALLEIDKTFPVESRVHFIDGPEPAKPPEAEPGGYPELGYELLGWEHLEARDYRFAIVIAMLAAFPENGGRGFYRVYHAPLTAGSDPAGAPADDS